MKGGKLGAGRSLELVNTFPEGWGRIPDNPIISTSLAALFKAGSGARSLMGGWSEDDRGRPAYRHLLDCGGEIVVRAAPYTRLQGSDAVDAQWAIVKGVSPLTLDVFTAILAQLCAISLDAHSGCEIPEAVDVTARAILRYKDLMQWGGEGAALRQRVDREIKRLSALRLDVRLPHGAPVVEGRGSDTNLVDRCFTLFDIVGSRTIRSARKAGTAVPETVWTIRSGHWAEARRMPGHAFRFVQVPQSILLLDHRRNRGSAILAKKISLGMWALWSAARASGALQFRICDLLEDIGELPFRDARGDGWGARMRDRFVQALALLREAGLMGGVEWPAGGEPDVRNRGKGWVAIWLEGKITLSGPAIADTSRGASAKFRRETRRSRKSAPALLELHRGSVIRAMRTDRNIPQYRLARELGISAAYLSQIENERRMASRSVLWRIADWANRNAGNERGRSAEPVAIESFGCAGGVGHEAETGNNGQHMIGRRSLQVATPCGPAGKDNRK